MIDVLSKEKIVNMQDDSIIASYAVTPLANNHIKSMQSYSMTAEEKTAIQTTVEWFGDQCTNNKPVIIPQPNQ
ncbi:MAG: hypothetical protein IPP76_13015 [Moraxellaceae bacterium]|nr:hypothetical protein [Moraxellaceae bacterium]